MIETRLTRAFDLSHPILSAPMANVAGGALAAAVTRGGGLGLIGGGYGVTDWLEPQFAAAGNTGVGVGLITWKLAEQPQVLDIVLARAPKALFLSFGDPMPFAGAIHEAGVPLICQVQRAEHAARAIDAGAKVLVAQGTEAGGHAGSRATMALVPEVVDFVADRAPDTLVLAAGGIADGRGLAAALMLGADGVLIGSRFWAADEALRPKNQQEQVDNASGDDTVQTRVPDIARGLDWPEPYRIRVLRNAFVDRWHRDPEGMRANAAAQADWRDAMAEGRTEVGSAIIGEAAGLIRGSRPAADILASISAEAEALLQGGWKKV